VWFNRCGNVSIKLAQEGCRLSVMCGQLAGITLISRSRFVRAANFTRSTATEQRVLQFRWQCISACHHVVLVCSCARMLTGVHTRAVLYSFYTRSLSCYRCIDSRAHFNTSTPRFNTSLQHLTSTPHFNTSLQHLTSTPHFNTSLQHLSSTPHFNTSLHHLT
jgi:hypothetical protein